jgi:hypothetical protein
MACGFALANKGHDARALQAYHGYKNIQHPVRCASCRRIVSSAEELSLRGAGCFPHATGGDDD